MHSSNLFLQSRWPSQKMLRLSFSAIFQVATWLACQSVFYHLPIFQSTFMVLENCLISKTFATFSSIRILAGYRACHVTYQHKSVLQEFDAGRPITEPDTKSSLLIGQPLSNLWSEFKLIQVMWQACYPAGIPSKVLFLGL